MAPRTLPADGVAQSLTAIDDALTLDFSRPLVFGGAGSGKSPAPHRSAVEAVLGNATLRAALENMRSEQDWLAENYAVLLIAAQAAVIESRTSRRNPITPILEALTDLGELPAPSARLHAQMPQTAAAWPTGAVG